MPTSSDLDMIENASLALDVDAIRRKHPNYSAARIAALMNEQPALRERVIAYGRRKVYGADVQNYMKRKAQDALQIVEPLKEASGMTKVSAAEVVSAAQTRLSRTLALCDEWDGLARICFDSLRAELHEYMELKNEKDEEAPPALFPMAMYETARKTLLASLDIVRVIRGDTQLQNIVKATNVNVNQGMSQADFHTALRGIAEHLGVSWEKMMEAYAMSVTERAKAGAKL